MKLMKRILETREYPELLEKRNDLLDQMDALINGAKAETRALNEEEVQSFEALKTQIADIDKTIQLEGEIRNFERSKTNKPNSKKTDELTPEEEAMELRSIFEGRAAMNTGTAAEGGAVVSEYLVKQIIKAIKDRSDVYRYFDATTVGGVLKIPVQASSGTANWVDEKNVPDSTPAATIPTLKLIELGQHRLYRESAITQQMLNTQDLDLRAFILGDIAETMVDSIEDAILNGDGTGKPTGILNNIPTSKKISVETRGAISIDDFKKCKAKLKRAAQKGAVWLMNAETYLLVDLLKDTDGRPLLQPDVANGTGYIILGIPVVITDAMPTPTTTGAKCLVALVNKAAYHTNTQKSMAVNIYDDSTYKRAGLIGYGCDIYMDGKPKDVDNHCAGIFNKSA